MIIMTFISHSVDRVVVLPNVLVFIANEKCNCYERNSETHLQTQFSGMKSLFDVGSFRLRFIANISRPVSDVMLGEQLSTLIQHFMSGPHLIRQKSIFRNTRVNLFITTFCFFFLVREASFVSFA